MPTSGRLDAAVYERAEALLQHRRRRLVRGGRVVPRWIGDGARFWYRLERPEGHQFVAVDTADGTKAPAFDHGRLAAALATASGRSVSAAALPFTEMQMTGKTIVFRAGGVTWRCSLDTYVCERADGHVVAEPGEAVSPDGKWTVVHREHDLWIRSVRTGDERRLTSDGTPDRAYGREADCWAGGVLKRHFGVPLHPPILAWSPDSRRIVTHRTDQRGVPYAHLVEATPPDGGRPLLHSLRYAMPGEEAVPRAELMVIDAVSGEIVSAKAEPLLMPLGSPIAFGRVWWSGDGAAVYYLEQPRDFRALLLRRLDPLTGETATLVEEHGEPRVDCGQYMEHEPLVRVLSNGREVVWYSQRDGWGHLYLYDTATHEVRCRLTSGDWAVQEILHVDEDRRVVYFTAAGLVEADVYRRQVCRVGLDGSGFARVSDDDLDHVATSAPNGRYYVDSSSTTDTPPVFAVRDWDGRQMMPLEQADISALLATGWTPPERFRVKAADGATDIYGALYRPPQFDPSQRYPVVDQAYPGPQANRVQPSFAQDRLYDTESVAALGFVVVAVDGRGTPGRSKDFHDYSYRRLGDAGCLEDHVAALRQLAESRPWMDLERVGIYGLSGGGFATVKAMCTFPDFYKVGVALAGNHDQRYYQLGWGEMYDGPFDTRTYERSSNVEIADKLRGKLLLIHGEMDDNVLPQLTLRLVDRLIAADKDFDMLLVPGAEHHFVGYEHYVTRRRWDFLVRHLMGLEPPEGYRLAPLPLDYETFKDLLEA